nr:putative reverse transcriptase domain-containing protein [Tanacetum cinerariifolium]
MGVWIKEKPKAVRDRQKSYVDYGRKSLEFEVGDRVLLNVTPWKGVVRFGKKQVTRGVSVYDTFHVSNLKRCLADDNLHVPLDELKVDKTLCIVEEPVEIMDREIMKLKRRKIALVKLRWNSKRDEASEVIISFIKKTQVNLQLQVQRVRTDNDTEFKNKTLAKFFDEVGITQQFSAARTPQQNGVVEKKNRTLVEAARTMLYAYICKPTIASLG